MTGDDRALPVAVAVAGGNGEPGAKWIASVGGSACPCLSRSGDDAAAGCKFAQQGVWHRAAGVGGLPELRFEDWSGEVDSAGVDRH